MTDPPSNASPPDDALIRLAEVLKRIPVSKASYYAGAGTLYPSLLRIGPRSTAVRFFEVKAWLADPEGWQLARRPKI